MSDFFNKLKKSIDKGTAIVSAKSNTLIETNKLKSEISAINKAKNEALMTLGRKAYIEGKEGTFNIEDSEALITKISELEAKVIDLEAKILLIQEEEKSKMDELNAEDVVAAEEIIIEEVEEVEDFVEDAIDEASDAAESLRDRVEDAVEDVQEEVQEKVEDVSEATSFEKPEQY